MAIVKMKRLEVVVPQRNLDELLQQLQAIGAVQCEETTRSNSPHAIAAAAMDALQQQESLLKRALDTIKHAPSPLLSDGPETISAHTLLQPESLERSIRGATELLALEQERQRTIVLIAQLAQRQEQLKFWLDWDAPLTLPVQTSLWLRYGTLPATVSLEQLSDAVSLAFLVPVNVDRRVRYCVAVCHQSVQESFETFLQANGFHSMEFPPAYRFARDEWDALNRQRAEQQRRLSELDARIASYTTKAEIWQQDLDQLAVVLERASVQGKLLQTEQTCCLTGWIPEPMVEKTVVLLTQCACAYEVTDPAPEDNVPVLLENNLVTQPLNVVTEMYSLPKYQSVDPNPLIAPWFCLFFGIMYADFGYGLILIALGLLGSRLIRRAGTLRQMAQLSVECGVATALFGWIFGSFFGDSLQYFQAFAAGGPAASGPPTWLNRLPLWGILDPLEDPMLFLYASLALGAAHLLTGMAIKAALLIRDGHPLDAVMDIGSWWLLFAGVVTGILGRGWIVATLGVSALLLTQGRRKPTLSGKILCGFASLYRLINYLGDLLSYTRLMALLLASSVIAQVFNMLCAMPGNLLVFLLTFLIAHAFNMFINIIGAYVHAARLQYLEFFNQFYEEGGKRFRPFAYHTRYTRIVQEDV